MGISMVCLGRKQLPMERVVWFSSSLASWLVDLAGVMGFSFVPVEKILCFFSSFSSCAYAFLSSLFSLNLFSPLPSSIVLSRALAKGGEKELSFQMEDAKDSKREVR